MKTVILFFFFLPLMAVSQSADEYYRLGKEAYDKKDYKGGVDNFTKAIQVTPKCYSYWYRGSSYWGLLDYAKAIEDFSRALLFAENNDDKASLLLNRADCEFALSDYKVAQKDYLEYLKFKPGIPDAYNQIGRTMLGLKDFEAAKESFRNAILLAENDENRAIYKYNIGISETELLNYAAAEAAFSEALKYNSKYLGAYYRRAEVNTARKNYTLALSDYDKAMELVKSDGSKAFIFRHKGLIYDLLNDPDNAFQLYKKATDADQTDADSWYDLGRLAKTKMKNEALALSFLQKAIDLSVVPDTNSTYAYAKTFLGKNSEAISFQLRKIQSSRNDAYRYKWELHNMACILALAGNSAKAIEYVDKSLVAGFNDYDHLLNDRDLRSLMNLPQWKAVLAKHKVPKPKF